MLRLSLCLKTCAEHIHSDSPDRKIDPMSRNSCPHQLLDADGSRGLYLLEPRYAVQAALANVCDIWRAQVFSTAAAIAATSIFA